MTRRAIAGAGLVLVVGVGAAGVGTGRLPVSWPTAASGASASPSATPTTATATVERRTLQTAADLTGALGYEGPSVLSSGAQGTVTWLPPVGTTIARNGALYELDGRVRPRLFFGSRPLWRPLGPGVSDGADVRQLEENLKALGYAPRNMRVDRHWDARTTTAVKRWQKATGRTVNGSLDGSDIAFLPGPIRVADHQAVLGARVGPGVPVLAITTTRRVVTLDLAASRQDLAKPGQAVTVTLPGDLTVNGHVRSVGRVATAGQNGNPSTVPVTVDLDPGSAIPDLDAAPATVHAVVAEHANVLAVPVNSLVALLEGGYAVEVVKDGAHRYVRVTPGLFQDGWVEVSGDGLQAGDTVVVAR